MFRYFTCAFAFSVLIAASAQVRALNVDLGFSIIDSINPEKVEVLKGGFPNANIANDFTFNTSVDIENLNGTINIPPSSMLSLGLSAAQIFLSEYNNRQIMGRLDRIDGKLNRIIDELGLIRGDLASIKIKLDAINKKLTELHYNIEESPYREIYIELTAQVNTALQMANDWQESINDPATSAAARVQLLNQMGELRRRISALVSSEYPYYFTTLTAALVVDRDLTAMIGADMAAHQNVKASVLTYLRNSIADEKATAEEVIPSDSYTLRTKKYLHQLDKEIERSVASAQRPNFVNPFGCPNGALQATIEQTDPPAESFIWESEAKDGVLLFETSRDVARFCLGGLPVTNPPNTDRVRIWSMYATVHNLAEVKYVEEDGRGKFVLGRWFMNPRSVQSCNHADGRIQREQRCNRGTQLEKGQTKVSLDDYINAWELSNDINTIPHAREYIRRLNTLLEDLANSRLTQRVISELIVDLSSN